MFASARPAGSLVVRSHWPTVVAMAAGLAAAVGVGRFAFTPILPLMEAQTALTPSEGGLLATANYLGYLIGAVAGIAVPWLSRARTAARVSGVVLVVTLVGMPLTEQLGAWIVLRTVAGIASAVGFLVVGNAILSRLGERAPHLVGAAYGGVGAGIALSGAAVGIISSVADWRIAWLVAAALTAALLAVSWRVGESRDEASTASVPVRADGPRRHRWFTALAVSYFFEGAGYIVAGTFLVAAVTATGPAWLAGSVWTIVGVAAIPSAALLTWLSLRVARPTLLVIALVVQAIAVALPALSGSPLAAVISAIAFGGTFVGITTVSLATGRHLGVGRGVAILTTGYSVGQVLGPVAVVPTLHSGYQAALLIAAGLILVAALAAAALRIRFPGARRPGAA